MANVSVLVPPLASVHVQSPVLPSTVKYDVFGAPTASLAGSAASGAAIAQCAIASEQAAAIAANETFSIFDVFIVFLFCVLASRSYLKNLVALTKSNRV